MTLNKLATDTLSLLRDCSDDKKILAEKLRRKAAYILRSNSVSKLDRDSAEYLLEVANRLTKNEKTAQ